MRKLTPFKQALLGGLTALALCALIGLLLRRPRKG